MEALSKESKFAALGPFEREINGRKVCKKCIARLEPLGCTSEPGDKYKQLQRSCTCIHSRASCDHGNSAAWFPVFFVI